FRLLGLLRFAFADPAFDAEFAIDSMGFGKAIINIGAERVQGDSTPVILLDAREFGAAEAAGTADFDAFSAEIFGGLEGFFHCAAERDAALELESDVFGNELGFGFRRLDFDDVDVNLFAGHLAELFLELIDFRAFAANNNAGAGSKNRDAAAARGTFDE